MDVILYFPQELEKKFPMDIILHNPLFSAGVAMNMILYFLHELEKKFL